MFIPKNEIHKRSLVRLAYQLFLHRCNGAT